MPGDLMDSVFEDIKNKKDKTLRSEPLSKEKLSDETLSNEALSDETLRIEGINIRLLNEAIQNTNSKTKDDRCLVSSYCRFYVVLKEHNPSIFYQRCSAFMDRSRIRERISRAGQEG